MVWDWHSRRKHGSSRILVVFHRENSLLISISEDGILILFVFLLVLVLGNVADTSGVPPRREAAPLISVRFTVPLASF